VNTNDVVMQISILKFPEQKIRMKREQTRKIPCLQGVETIKRQRRVGVD